MLRNWLLFLNLFPNAWSLSAVNPLFHIYKCISNHKKGFVINARLFLSITTNTGCCRRPCESCILITYLYNSYCMWIPSPTCKIKMYIPYMLIKFKSSQRWEHFCVIELGGGEELPKTFCINSHNSTHPLPNPPPTVLLFQLHPCLFAHGRDMSGAILILVNSRRSDIFCIIGAWWSRALYAALCWY